MRFASCVLLDNKIILHEYEKDYSRNIEKEIKVLSYEEAPAYLQTLDFIDIAMPGKDILFFTKQYPPVKKFQLDKIIEQDVEAVTPFDPADIIIDFSQFFPNLTTVFMSPKNNIKALISKLGNDFSEKVRAIIPEELLFFRAPAESAIFIGSSYSILVDRDGQVIRNTGFNKLYTEIYELFGKNDEEIDDLKRWLESINNIAADEGLSEDEIRVRKKIEKFFAELYSEFEPFMKNHDKMSFYFSDIVVGNGEQLIKKLFPDAEIYPVLDYLRGIHTEADHHETINLSKGDFAYKGGFNFYKTRVFITAGLIIAAFIILFFSMEMRILYLDSKSSEIDAKAKKITKEILGKEYPSLKQALSTMVKTIEGKGKEKKKLYPYSSLYIMEQIFPDIAFEGSSIEVLDLLVKDGKVKLSGEAMTDKDIFRMIEQLEKMETVSNMNKGAVTQRRDKQSFTINFEYKKKEKEEKKEKGKEKGKTPKTKTEKSEEAEL